MAGTNKKAKKNKKRKSTAARIVQANLAVVLIVLAAIAVYCIYRYAGVLLQYQAEAKMIVANSPENVFNSCESSVIYDNNGNVIATISAEKKSYYLTYDEIPIYVQQAFITTEDKDFYEHHGVDYSAVLRAVVAYVENKGVVTQGGSTITQQLVKNVYLNSDVTMERKLREMFVALELEKIYTKEQILEFYINNIYFSNGYYGIQAASQGYFGRDVNELTLSEMAFLCAIPNRPTYYDPYENKEHTLERRDRVLGNMLAEKVIDFDTYYEAINEEIILPEKVRKVNSYVETYVKYCAAQELMRLSGFEFRYDFASDEEKAKYYDEYDNAYDECYIKLYSGGFQIYTSIDMTAQRLLQKTVNEKCKEYSDEITDDGVYTFQASATLIDNESGKVRAIVGGRSQNLPGYTLNRAYQSHRQPGSSIKPLIVYTPALEQGYTADSKLLDTRTADCPANASGSYDGNISLRYAVTVSKNTTAWKLYRELGGGKKLLHYLKDMNFTGLTKSDETTDVVAIGGMSYGVSTLEMASAYCALENDGVFRRPTCIKEICSKDQNAFVTDVSTKSTVYKKNAARQMTDILKDVLARGTGYGHRLDNAICAAKTGTTNDDVDSWFCGYSSYYTLAVWTGYDYNRTIEDTAIAGSIWHDTMHTLHLVLPVKDFAKPEAEEKKEEAAHNAALESQAESEAESRRQERENAKKPDAADETTAPDELTTQEVVTETTEEITTEEVTYETETATEDSTESSNEN